MCGRFIDPDLRDTDAQFSILKINPFPRRRFNVKPTNGVLLLDGPERTPLTARWWLVPSWHKGDLKDWKASTFNARIEEAQTKPSFRAAWKDGRCLIPAGGYYEWTGERGSKTPHFICSAGNAPTLWFAGLRSPWRELQTCTIVTRAASSAVAAVHDRMPAILSIDEQEAWLAGSDDLSIGAGAALRHYPIAPFGADDDGPELIEPAE